MPRKGEFVTDIRIEDMDVFALSSFDTAEIMDMVRPQVVCILREHGIRDPLILKEYAKAIVDGTPLPRSASPEEKSDDRDFSDPDTPPHTKEDS